MNTIELPHAVPVPADLDAPDRVLWGATGRQVAIIAPTLLAALLVWYRLAGQVDPRLLLVATAPVLAAVGALALIRVDGFDLDRLVLAAIRRPRRPLAPGRAEAAMARAAARRGAPVPGPVPGPVHGLSEAGLLDLGGAGVAIAIGVGCVNFSLRSAAEQEQLVAVFAGLVGSIGSPLQVVIATRPVDLSAYLAQARHDAEQLPEPDLAGAAAAHLEWLGGLTRGQRLLERQVTVVVRGPDAAACERAAEQVEAFAGAIGVRSHRLDGPELAERVRAGIDPYGTPVRRAES